MQRWLVLTLGLGLAAAAAWVLLSGAPGMQAPESRRGDEPSDHIDARSRAALQQILRENDDASERP